MPLRVDSVPQQERVGGRVKVCVPQGQQPAGRRERQDAFGGLEERDSAQTDWKSAGQFIRWFQSSRVRGPWEYTLKPGVVRRT